MAVPRGSSPGAVDECGASGVVPLVKIAYGAAGDATQLAADATGLQVNPAQLDVENDEVATGATADATGGLSVSTIVSVSTGFDAQVVKASAGRLYSIDGINFDSAKLAFVKIYNKATAPDPSADSALLKMQYYVRPVFSTYDVQQKPMMWPHGIAFSTGIALVITQDSGTGETAVDANDLFVTLTYK